MKNKDFEYIEKLASLYGTLERLTSSTLSPENPCGDCHSCCTYPIRLQVSSLELLHMRESAPTFPEKKLLQFINKELPPDSVCPNYDQSARNCLVYRLRPMCCRVFGYVPFRSLRAECAFQIIDKTTIPWRDIEKVMQQFAELRLHYFHANKNTVKPRTLVDFLTLGNVYIEEGEKERAFLCYDKALAIDKGSALAHSYQAKKNELLQHFKEAEKSYYKATGLDPEDPALILKLGYLLHTQGRYVEALKLYEEVLHRDRDNQMAYGNMGLAHLALNNQEQALECYKNACRLDPESITFTIMRGNLLSQMGRYSEALSEFLAALRKDPSDPLLHLCAGNTHKKMNEYDKALQYFENCLQHTKSFDLIRVVQNEIAAIKSNIPA